MRRLSRLGLAVILGVGFTVAAVGPAHAEPLVATLTMSGEMHYEAALNQANRLTVSNPSPGVVAFTDVYPITFSTPDGSTCSYPYATQTTVHCVHAATFLDIKTSDLDDVIDNRTTSNVHASGGDGNDVIKMGGHATPAAAGDASGGPGDDVIHSGPGDDWINGGTGSDTVTFQGRTAKITATLVSPAHGGDPLTGEADVYQEIENLTGGGAADTLTGDGNANVIDGGWYTTPCQPFPSGGGLLVPTAIQAPPPCTTYSGDDVINGGGGPDILRGRQGADTINGGTGNDTLYGDAGFDSLNGGADSDICYPGADGATTSSCSILAPLP
ncbi:calcium-binding protein [Dactylosporangium sp. NPDC006015]|uniref:calcium-binding protein n=1 Tax=Dactylosporangium sp. NPDC006015 TaxID=3154576 RepID=UPI0033B22CF8